MHDSLERSVDHTQIDPASFRDPSGFIYTKDQKVYRQINRTYKPHYDALLSSGLYDELVKKQLLVAHQEVKTYVSAQTHTYKIIEPCIVPFISYPYEWCFSQLKSAALLTLKIQKIAIANKMILKDASAFNVQFLGPNPIFIDTLSFEIYDEKKTWNAYRQFCMHFLAPLLLMARIDVGLLKLFQTNIDGIPLNLASKLLGIKSWLKPSIALHIHLHALLEKRYENSKLSSTEIEKGSFSEQKMFALIESLSKTTESLKLKNYKTQWSNYEDIHNYSEKTYKRKEEILQDFFTQISHTPLKILDIGANSGHFSRIFSNSTELVISIDKDHAAVEKNFIEAKKTSKLNVFPIMNDICSPSPNIGWANIERTSLMSRVSVDLTLMLALIHHLVIFNQVPFKKIASFASQTSRWLIIEFVKVEDSQLQQMLTEIKKDQMRYSQDNFELDFKRFFFIRKKTAITGSHRILYLLERRSSANEDPSIDAIS